MKKCEKQLKMKDYLRPLVRKKGLIIGRNFQIAVTVT